MTGEMIERGARALYRLHAPSLGPLELGEDVCWPRYANDARAVIAAMQKDPSEAMLAAGRPWATNDTLPPNCWIKMMAAALKDDK